MFRNWAGVESVSRYLAWQAHRSPEETKRLLLHWCSDYECADNYNWAVEYGGEPIGNIRVVHFQESSEWAELGYCMSPAYWNRGLMTEAAQAVIQFLFAQVGVNRVGISPATNNPASQRVAEKCGLTREGIRQQYFKTRAGEFLDMVDYRILKMEWEQTQQKNRRKQNGTFVFQSNQL